MFTRKRKRDLQEAEEKGWIPSSSGREKYAKHGGEVELGHCMDSLFLHQKPHHLAEWFEPEKIEDELDPDRKIRLSPLQDALKKRPSALKSLLKASDEFKTSLLSRCK